jgi:putative phage-type endonuclease
MSVPQQNTSEWIEWRKNKIGASDCAAIMGVNPWVSPYQLWQRKMGLIPEQEMNEAMQAGKDNEGFALDQFNDQMDLNLKPSVHVNPLYNYLIASMDGWDGENRVAVEIKCSRKLYEMAQNAQIPIYYEYQMLHQMMVLELEWMFYYVWHDGQGVQLEYYRDAEKITRILDAEIEFYRCMTEFDCPPMCDRDFQNLTDHETMNLVDRWKYAKKQREIHEEEEKRLRMQLIANCQGQSSICNGIKIQKIPRRGSIQYDKVPQLLGVDLEIFRKAATDTWRITEE